MLPPAPAQAAAAEVWAPISPSRARQSRTVQGRRRRRCCYRRRRRRRRSQRPRRRRAPKSGTATARPKSRSCCRGRGLLRVPLDSIAKARWRPVGGAPTRAPPGGAPRHMHVRLLPRAADVAAWPSRAQQSRNKPGRRRRRCRCRRCRRKRPSQRPGRPPAQAARNEVEPSRGAGSGVAATVGAGTGGGRNGLGASRPKPGATKSNQAGASAQALLQTSAKRGRRPRRSGRPSAQAGRDEVEPSRGVGAASLLPSARAEAAAATVWAAVGPSRAQQSRIKQRRRRRRCCYRRRRRKRRLQRPGRRGAPKRCKTAARPKSRSCCRGGGRCCGCH